MNLPVRSAAAVLLGLTFTFGAPTPRALAVAADPDCTPSGNKCDGTEPGCIPSDQQPKKCDDEETEDTIPRTADTGFGGTSSSGSESTVLLVGGGVLLLGAAVGVRRAQRGGKA